MLTDRNIKEKVLEIFKTSPYIELFSSFNKKKYQTQYVFDNRMRECDIEFFAECIIKPMLHSFLGPMSDNIGDTEGDTHSLHVSINSKSDDIDFYILRIGIKCS